MILCIMHTAVNAKGKDITYQVCDLKIRLVILKCGANVEVHHTRNGTSSSQQKEMSSLMDALDRREELLFRAAFFIVSG